MNNSDHTLQLLRIIELEALVKLLEEEIAELKELADSSYNVCQDALSKVKALEDELAESKEKRANLLNHIKGQKIWIKSLKKSKANSIPRERTEALINTCIELKIDLMTRGIIDSKGFIVVDVSSVKWSNFNAAIKSLSNQTKQGESNE